MSTSPVAQLFKSYIFTRCTNIHNRMVRTDISRFLISKPLEMLFLGQGSATRKQ